MKLRYFVIAILIILIPVLCYSQGHGKHKSHKAKHSKVKHMSPGWGKKHGYQNNYHVYFPDYYTFYDPARGYVYWNNNYWVTSQSLPSFLTSVDLGRARIQILTNEPLSAHPEVRYHTYIGQYPARNIGISIPIPR